MFTVSGLLSPYHLEAGTLPGEESISKSANRLLSDGDVIMEK